MVFWCSYLILPIVHNMYIIELLGFTNVLCRAQIACVGKQIHSNHTLLVLLLNTFCLMLLLNTRFMLPNFFFTSSFFVLESSCIHDRDINYQFCYLNNQKCILAKQCKCIVYFYEIKNSVWIVSQVFVNTYFDCVSVYLCVCTHMCAQQIHILIMKGVKT